MENCLFCKIVREELDTDIIYENKNIIAFRDINPQAPVHILLIPKKHFSTLNDLTSRDIELAGDLIYSASRLAKKRELQRKDIVQVSIAMIGEGRLFIIYICIYWVEENSVGLLAKILR